MRITAYSGPVRIVGIKLVRGELDGCGTVTLEPFLRPELVSELRVTTLFRGSLSKDIYSGFVGRALPVRDRLSE